jgi:Trp operon repressor
MQKLKLIQCILSILYTVEDHENVQPDIRYMQRLLHKAVNHKSFSERENEKIENLSLKYQQLLKSVMSEEEKKNKVGRIALMNDLCYNYYKTESLILILQDKKLDSCIENINKINRDIELFNQNYKNNKYVEKNEKKYFQYIQQLFSGFELSHV